MPAQEAKATLSARSSRVAETKPGSAKPTALPEELHPWARVMLLAQSQGLEHEESRRLLSPSASGRFADQTVADAFITQSCLGSSSRQHCKQDEAKHPIPWRPTGSGHTPSVSTPAEKQQRKSRHRRGFCMSRTPALSARRPWSPQSHTVRPHGEDAMLKMLYWCDNMGSFVDGGNVVDSMDAAATLTTGLLEEMARLDQCNTKSLDPCRYGEQLAKKVVLPPSWEVWGYKLVAKVGGRYFSLWAGEAAEYEMGMPIKDQAFPERKGGLYICDSAASAARQYIATSFPGNALCVAMLRCACSGPFVDYGGGKAACSVLTPLGEIPLPSDGTVTAPWDRLSATGASRGAHCMESGRMSTMPGWEVVGYTLVAKMGQPPLRERHFSLWSTEAFRYDLGVPTRDEALTDLSRDHLWVVSSPTEAHSVRIAIAEKLRSSGVDTVQRVLLRCACKGPFAELPDGRVACSKLTPLDEVAAPNSEECQAAEFVPAPPEHPRARLWCSPGAASTRRPRPPKRPASAPFHGRRLMT